MFQLIPVVKDFSPLADGELTWDLPVHPLSALNIVIKCLNVTDEATLAQLLALITKIRIVHLGTAIIEGSAVDLYRNSSYLLKTEPWVMNKIATDNGVRFLSLLLPLSRHLYSKSEGFPATKKGEFELQMTVDIATTEADGLIIQADALCMLDGSPSEYLKYTTHTKTPSAVGDIDIELPIGNKFAGLLLYSTTIPSTTAWTTTVNKVTLLKDDANTHFIGNFWESIQMLNSAGLYYLGDHSAAFGSPLNSNYAYLDFDLNRDGAELFETEGAGNVILRVDAGDTNEIRVIPNQVVAVG